MARTLEVVEQRIIDLGQRGVEPEPLRRLGEALVEFTALHGGEDEVGIGTQLDELEWRSQKLMTEEGYDRLSVQVRRMRKITDRQSAWMDTDVDAWKRLGFAMLNTVGLGWVVTARLRVHERGLRA